jgi:hypothetical protein
MICSYWLTYVFVCFAGVFILSMNNELNLGLISLFFLCGEEIEGVELKEESNKDKKKRKEITEVEGKKGLLQSSYLIILRLSLYPCTSDHETHKKKKSKGKRSPPTPSFENL